MFRAVGDGEVREAGMFEGVECPRGGVIFKVRLPSSSGPGQRESVRPGRVLQLSQRASRDRWRAARGPKPERVYLTYRSTGGAPGTDGVAVAIELLPDDYQP